MDASSMDVRDTYMVGSAIIVGLGGRKPALSRRTDPHRIFPRMSDRMTRLNAALGGRYRIESELGEGGMATVYLVVTAARPRGSVPSTVSPGLGTIDTFRGRRGRD